MASGEDPKAVDDEDEAEQREQHCCAPLDDMLGKLLAQQCTDPDGEGVGDDHPRVPPIQVPSQLSSAASVMVASTVLSPSSARKKATPGDRRPVAQGRRRTGAAGR